MRGDAAVMSRRQRRQEGTRVAVAASYRNSGNREVGNIGDGDDESTGSDPVGALAVGSWSDSYISSSSPP